MFCIYCKLFSRRPGTFSNDGFNDWKHTNLIQQHETTKYHSEAARLYVKRSLEAGKLNSLLTKQINDEVQYWRDVLKRVFTVVSFLASRGLPLRGSNQHIGSVNNGNYLGIMELISEYDPFLRSHIDNYANRGKGRESLYARFVEASTSLKLLIQHLTLLTSINSQLSLDT